MTTGLWDVILPELGENKVKNPAATITGNLTAVATGTVSRVTTYSLYGPACHRIQAAVDNDGGYFTLDTLTNAIHYMTLRVHSSSDVATFDCSLDNATFTEPTLLVTEGSWYVYGIQFPAAQANASTALRVLQKGAGAVDLYIGHVQVEANTYPTTPIMGSFLPSFKSGYYWRGTPHASASVRRAQERSGGKVVDMEDTLGVNVRWAAGIGMPQAVHQTQKQALLPGERFTGQKVLPRVIDLTAVMGKVIPVSDTHSVRQNLIDALKLDLVPGKQPVMLRYRGALSTKPVEFACYYDSGLEFDTAGSSVDQAPVRLICYDPFGYELGEASAQLTTTQSIANADYGLQRIAGVWSNISTLFDGDIKCFGKAANGNIYIGGIWAADVSTAADGFGIGIIEYNPITGTFTSLGTGLGGNKDVHDMLVAPNGDVYIVGDFLNAGGVAAADYAAYFDISAGAWVAMGAGLGAIGHCIAMGPDGSKYIGGEFTNLTDANGDYVTHWIGGAYVSMGSGLAGPCWDVLAAPDGTTVYAAHDTTLGGGGIMMFDGATWSTLGSGISGGSAIAYSLALDAKNHLFFGGDFLSADGVTDANYIGMWNGKTVIPLMTGVSGVVRSLTLLSTGELLVGGYDGSKLWNGYTWATPPIDLPAAGATIYAALEAGEDLYVGYDWAGTATSSYLNTITNNGKTIAYPVVVIKREGGTSATLEWMRNETTGKTLYFNYALLDGEELTLDFRLKRRSITSSYYGNVLRAALRGSELSEFFLQPGANEISVYISQVGAPTMTQYMTWRTTHWSVDGAAA